MPQEWRDMNRGHVCEREQGAISNSNHKRTHRHKYTHTKLSSMITTWPTKWKNAHTTHCSHARETEPRNVSNNFDTGLTDNPQIPAIRTSKECHNTTNKNFPPARKITSSPQTEHCLLTRSLNAKTLEANDSRMWTFLARNQTTSLTSKPATQFFRHRNTSLKTETQAANGHLTNLARKPETNLNSCDWQLVTSNNFSALFWIAEFNDCDWQLVILKHASVLFWITTFYDCDLQLHRLQNASVLFWICKLCDCDCKSLINHI